jgi:hypothetical protein
MNHFHVLFCLTINIIHYIYYVYVSSKATKIFYLSRLRNFKLAYMVYHSKIFNTISLLQHFSKTTIYLKHFLRFFFAKPSVQIFFSLSRACYFSYFAPPLWHIQSHHWSWILALGASPIVFLQNRSYIYLCSMV